MPCLLPFTYLDGKRQLNGKHSELVRFGVHRQQVQIDHPYVYVGHTGLQYVLERSVSQQQLQLQIDNLQALLPGADHTLPSLAELHARHYLLNQLVMLGLHEFGHVSVEAVRM